MKQFHLEHFAPFCLICRDCTTIMPQKVAQNDGLALLLKSVCHTSHTNSCRSGRIQNVLNIPNVACFWTNLTLFWPIVDVDAPILWVLDPILAENTKNQGVKSKINFCFMKYPFHIMALTLLFRIPRFWYLGVLNLDKNGAYLGSLNLANINFPKKMRNIRIFPFRFPRIWDSQNLANLKFRNPKFRKNRPSLAKKFKKAFRKSQSVV